MPGMTEKVMGIIVDDAGRDLLGTIPVSVEHFAIPELGPGWQGTFRVPDLRHLIPGEYTLRLSDGREAEITITNIDGGREVSFESAGPFRQPAGST